MFSPSAQSQSIPAPTGGWNARDPIALMPPTDAIKLINWIPTTSDLELRNGFIQHSTGLGSGVVETLIEYNPQSGTSDLIAAANGNIYDASAASASSLGSGFSSNRWEGVNFRNLLIMANGIDQPQQYNGSALSDATYTGSGLTDEDLFCPVIYNSRIYFLEANTASIWYGSVNTAVGALTQFDFQSLLKRGGALKWAGTWSQDSGDGLSEYFVVCSEKGEVVVYQGTYPGDTNTWAIAGVYYLPVPIGRRSVIRTGADLMIITEQGVIPLSSVISQGGMTTGYQAMTDKVRQAFTAAARAHRGSFGWEGFVYPRRDLGIVNIPTNEGSAAEQYVINTITGAWTRFTGIPAQCWCLFNEKPYFGGTDGKVYEWDNGQSDNGANIETKIRTAFNYFDNRSQNKRFTMGRPIVTASADMTFVFQVDTDFAETTITDTASITGSAGAEWDSATWDADAWSDSNLRNDDWYSLTGLGRAASIVVEADVQDLNANIAAFDIVYEAGGYV